MSKTLFYTLSPPVYKLFKPNAYSCTLDLIYNQNARYLPGCSAKALDHFRRITCRIPTTPTAKKSNSTCTDKSVWMNETNFRFQLEYANAQLCAPFIYCLITCRIRKFKLELCDAFKVTVLILYHLCFLLRYDVI